MVFPTISNPKTTVWNQFGGDVMNTIQLLFSAINIASIDSTNKPTINTDFRFRSGRFILQDADYTHELKFITPQLINNANITFPINLAPDILNEILFANVSQIITNKQINASDNIITNISNDNIANTANISWTKVSKTGASFGDFSNVNLTGLQDNYSIRWDAVTSKWVVYNIASFSGETNTVTNLTGLTGAVGLYKQKVGVNFEFKVLNSAHAAILVTNDVDNNQVTIGVRDATTALKGVMQFATSAQTTASLAIQASDTRLSNARTPTAHASTHKNAGSDALKINELAAGTANITTPNTTIAANGLAPILPNNANMFLNGVGGWSEPVGTASGVSGTGSIIRGVATRTGNGTTKVFTIAHGMSVTPTAYFVDPVTIDAQGFFTKSVDNTNITITYTVAPPSTNGVNNLKFAWVVFDSGTGSTMGEANTYSSVGTGVPITLTKSGVDLPFRSLFAGSNKISIVQNPNDVSFDVNQANLTFAWSQITSGIPIELVRIDEANSFGDFDQTFKDNRLLINNPADTFAYTIVASAIAAGRTVTLPLLTANDTFVMAAFTQTLTNKTLTTPVIAAIKNGSFNFTIPTLTASDTAVGKATTDTLTNKTLTNPIIAAITNGSFLFSIPTLTASDTAVGKNTVDTVTNKTINLTNNTITDTGALAGGIPLHNGTKFLNLPKGADGTFLGVASGNIGYYTPPVGSGGSLPAGDSVPATGRYGAFWGGTTIGDGLMASQITANSTTYSIISATESETAIYTAAADDAIAELKSGVISRQSDIVFKAKWAAKQTTNTVIRIGLSSQTSLPVGSGHDSPLNNASGVLITYVSDIETNYRIARNGGSTTDTDTTTTIAGNTTTAHTVEIILNTSGLTVIIDGTTLLSNVTTAIPALTTAMQMYAHIESIGSTAKGLGIRWMQVTCL